MISKEKVQELIKRAYSIAATHGFHEVDRSNAHFLMLVVSEIGEMVEADRKSRRAFVGDKLSISDETFAEWFESNVKDTLEDELADVAIRLFDFCGTFGLDVPTFDNVDDLAANWKELFSDAMLTENAFVLVQLCSGVFNELPKNALSKCMGQILFLYTFGLHTLTSTLFGMSKTN